MYQKLTIVKIVIFEMKTKNEHENENYLFAKHFVLNDQYNHVEGAIW